MSSINTSISQVRELLLDPKDQAPTVKQVFGAVLREFQTFYNELANSSVAWTYGETTVSLGGQLGDYTVNENESIGKILFVSMKYANGGYFPIAFTNMSDASTNWWSYYPVIPDESNAAPYNVLGMEAAFYRKDGQLRVRLGENLRFGGELRISYATGNWTENADPAQIAVLTQYHSLPEIRAAQAMIEACEWRNEAYDDKRKRNLALSLKDQEMRVYDQFRIAKRSPHADQPSTRASWTNQGTFGDRRFR